VQDTPFGARVSPVCTPASFQHHDAAGVRDRVEVVPAMYCLALACLTHFESVARHAFQGCWSIKTEVRDKTAIQAACQRLQLQQPEASVVV
jgi:hypothetical protein